MWSLQPCGAGTGTGHMQVDVHEMIDLTEGSRHPCKPISDTYEK